MYFLFVILHPEGTYFPGRHEVWMSHMGSFRIWNLEFLLSPQAAMSSFELDRLWVCKHFIRHAARFSAWHPFWHLICSGKYCNRLTGNLFFLQSNIYSRIVSDVFCLSICHILWHLIGLSIWQSYLTFFRATCLTRILSFCVAFYLNILSFYPAPFLAFVWRPTRPFWNPILHFFWNVLGPVRAHTDLELAPGQCVPRLPWSRSRFCVCAQIAVEFDTMFHR